MDLVRRSFTIALAALALVLGGAACSSDGGSSPFGRSKPELDDLSNRARTVNPTPTTALPEADRAAIAQCLQENGHDVDDGASVGDMLLAVGASEYGKCG